MKRSIVAVLLLSLGFVAHSAEVTVELKAVSGDGVGESIGQVVIAKTPYGLLFTPHLSTLSAGLHGFHIHENGSCAPTEKDGVKVAAGAAGGHFDPAQTKQHLGPYNDKGHLGDLPALYVASDGVANYPVLAPRLKSLSQIDHRALMVHVGADNHSDHPQPLGGGGVRMACGVIEVGK